MTILANVLNSVAVDTKSGSVPYWRAYIVVLAADGIAANTIITCLSISSTGSTNVMPHAINGDTISLKVKAKDNGLTWIF